MTDKPATDSPERPRAADEAWASLASSLADEQRARAASTTGTPPPPRGMQRNELASAVALLFAFVAVVLTGMLWWQYRQFYVSLDQTDAAAAEALTRVRAEQRALQDRLTDTGDDLATLTQSSTTLSERLDAVPGRFAELEARLDAVQGGSFDARSDLLRTEAEYYLVVANTELTLTHDFATALTALELADGRLAELGDPQLAPVREKLAGELLVLRSMRLPDVEGIVFSLGRLAARADQLPLRADLPPNLGQEPDAALDAEPGLGRLWLAIKGTFLDLVRIERRDDPVPQALSAAERLLARRQLQLELELARIAALRADSDAFTSGLETAIMILRRDFDAASADVEGALALLGELRAFEVDPERPDISGSLNLLRELEGEAR
ncbi:MAG TPA: uroporphyrinogen-III C-methyltransferase [Gammaproteobacteria bacterium]